MGSFSITTAAKSNFPSAEQREQIVELLATTYMFPLDKLLAWGDRLLSGSWWTSPDAPESITYSPTMEAFLAHCWGEESYAEDMDMVVNALYLARGWRNQDVWLFGREIHPVHDGLLLLLDNHIDRLKTVWRLDQGDAKEFPADVAALSLLDAATQESPAEVGFADWVLDTWLPAHCLYYGRKAIEREKEEKRLAGNQAGSGVRSMRAGGPGDLVP